MLLGNGVRFHCIGSHGNHTTLAKHKGNVLFWARNLQAQGIRELQQSSNALGIHKKEREGVEPSNNPVLRSGRGIKPWQFPAASDQSAGMQTRSEFGYPESPPQLSR